MRALRVALLILFSGFVLFMVLHIMCGPAWTAGGKPELVEVRSMENCPPCERVLAKLDADGVKYTVKTTYINTATSYPTCIYADGSWDSGNAVLSGNYTAKGTIPVTKLARW